MIERMILASLAALLAVPLAAEEEGPAESCELHVWPTANLRFSNQGMWDNFRAGYQIGILGEMLSKPEGRMERSDRGPDVHPDTSGELMAASEQVELLKKLRIASVLGLPAHRLVIHDTALTSRDIRIIKGHYEPASAPCYADLVLDTLMFSNEWGNGQNLKSFYRFRNFGTGAAPVRSFGAWVDTRLAIEPEELPAKFDEARAEMRAAFNNNVALFGAALSKRPPQHQSRGRKSE